MVRYPNIKIYATEVKYRFILLTSVEQYRDTLDIVHEITLKYSEEQRLSGLVI